MVIPTVRCPQHSRKIFKVERELQNRETLCSVKNILFLKRFILF